MSKTAIVENVDAMIVDFYDEGNRANIEHFIRIEEFPNFKAGMPTAEIKKNVIEKITADFRRLYMALITTVLVRFKYENTFVDGVRGGPGKTPRNSRSDSQASTITEDQYDSSPESSDNEDDCVNSDVFARSQNNLLEWDWLLKGDTCDPIYVENMKTNIGMINKHSEMRRDFMISTVKYDQEKQMHLMRFDDFELSDYASDTLTWIKFNSALTCLVRKYFNCLKYLLVRENDRHEFAMFLDDWINGQDHVHMNRTINANLEHESNMKLIFIDGFIMEGKSAYYDSLQYRYKVPEFARLIRMMINETTRECILDHPDLVFMIVYMGTISRLAKFQFDYTKNFHSDGSLKNWKLNDATVLFERGLFSMELFQNSFPRLKDMMMLSISNALKFNVFDIEYRTLTMNIGKYPNRYDREFERKRMHSELDYIREACGFYLDMYVGWYRYWRYLRLDEQSEKDREQYGHAKIQFWNKCNMDLMRTITFASRFGFSTCYGTGNTSSGLVEKLMRHYTDLTNRDRLPIKFLDVF